MALLRPYQERAIAMLRAAARDRPVYVAPTGSGKTVVAHEIVRSAASKGRMVMFVAHTREIILQTARRFDCAVFMGSKSEVAPVTCASVQTLASRIRKERPVPPADLIIYDECHHVRAKAYETVREHYSDAWYIGLTATPCRLDGRGLGKWFGAIIQTVTVRELIEAGHLATFRYLAPPAPDLSGARTRQGDYVASDVGEIMDQPRIRGRIVDHYLEHLRGRTALAFCASIPQSRNLVETFLAAGVPAWHLDAKSPAKERDAVFSSLAAGGIRVVSNVGLVSEGFDCPSLDGVILARPTQSLCVARQQAGRALRPPGPVILLDHVGLWENHGLPDEEETWTLDDRRQANTCSVAPSKLCPSCYAVLSAAAKVCPECSHVFDGEEQEVPEESDESLVEITESSAEYYKSVLAHAHHMNYKVGWADLRYHNREGRWPRRRGLQDAEMDRCRYRLGCRFCDSIRARRAQSAARWG